MIDTSAGNGRWPYPGLQFPGGYGSHNSRRPV